MRPYINPVMATPEEVTTQRFYLRKIEGAEVLLAYETNFFRQELHKWAPVAPEPPPLLENSYSTRKPRPTKQQKMMTQLGIENPEDLPQQYRTKQHTFTKTRKNSDSHSSTKGHHPLQAAPRHRNRSDTPHSASTSNGADSHTRSHRLPPPLSSTHADPTYTPYFPTTGSPNNAHHHPGSPVYGSASYMSNHHAQNPHPHLRDSPGFPPRSPLSRSGAPLDPSLFSPTSSHFAASMSLTPSGHGGPNHILSPPHHSFTTPSSGVHMDTNIFDDFVADPTDDLGGRNEAAEALEERRREEDEEQGRIFADQYLN